MLQFIHRVMAIAVLACIWLAGLTCYSAADWQDYVEDPPEQLPAEELEADPAWKKYAFDLPYADNTGRLAFEDLARSGEPFVLFWWLSNCPMCHLQLPYVERLQNQIDEHGLGLSLVSICIDSNRLDCLEVIQEKKISFPVLIDQRARRTKGKYDLADGTPMTYIFGKRGVFLETINGFQSSFGETVLRTLEIELPAVNEDSP